MARRLQSGLTLLEIMIVIAIIGLILAVLGPGMRAITHGDLVEDTSELVAYMRRASQLAIEGGEQHRVVFDMDTGNYLVEVCQGQATLARNKEVVRNDDDKTKQALDKGNERLRDLPADTLAVGDPDEATKRALAIAGHHVADRTCSPVKDAVTGNSILEDRDKRKEEWLRKLHANNGVKFKEIWVQHKDDSTTKGQVAIYFYPNGSSEKAVIELTDGDTTKSVLVYGLTGWIQQKSGKLDNIDDHMLRNALGDRDKQREVQ